MDAHDHYAAAALSALLARDGMDFTHPPGVIPTGMAMRIATIAETAHQIATAMVNAKPVKVSKLPPPHERPTAAELAEGTRISTTHPSA